MADAPLLHERLRDDSETVREFAEQGLWLLWSRSGDAEIDRRMARGTDEMQAGRLADSVATFSEIIRRKPDFAEGWNRRAAAYYLAGEYEKSIADCAEVLKRNPRHFGAKAFQADSGPDSIRAPHSTSDSRLRAAKHGV